MPNLPSWQEVLDLSAYSANADDSTPWRSQRGILPMSGNRLIAQVTVSEDADDELMITDHPIQAGAVINDHAFKRPAELRVQLGWSNAYAAYIGRANVKEVYEQILMIQASRLPCTVFTAKRIYENMLIQSLRTHTDAKFEFSFLADVAFKEVVLVNTSVVAVVGQTINAAAMQDQRFIPSTNTGSVNATPANVVVADPASIGF